MASFSGGPIVDEALTRKIAKLSRVKLTDEEVRAFTPQVKDILEYVNQLSSVDVQGVEPLYSPFDQELTLREDKVIFFDGEILKHAPEVLYDGYKVPPIL